MATNNPPQNPQPNNWYPTPNAFAQQQQAAQANMHMQSQLANALGLTPQQMQGMMNTPPPAFVGQQFVAMHQGLLGNASHLPQPEPVPVLWEAGQYCLIKYQGHYRLGCGRAGVYIASWHNLPTRRELAVAIIADRQRRPLVGARDIDGSLRGMRYFSLQRYVMRKSERFYITSPTQGTLWDSEVLSVVAWDESQVVRGMAGIHAAWPTMSAQVKPAIDYQDDEHLYLAEVRGYGKYVTGKMGWRAERCIIDKFYLPKTISAAKLIELESNYPNIEFKENPWTSERLLRSARLNRSSSPFLKQPQP